MTLKVSDRVCYCITCGVKIRDYNVSCMTVGGVGAIYNLRSSMIMFCKLTQVNKENANGVERCKVAVAAVTCS